MHAIRLAVTCAGGWPLRLRAGRVPHRGHQLARLGCAGEEGSSAGWQYHPASRATTPRSSAAADRRGPAARHTLEPDHELATIGDRRLIHGIHRQLRQGKTAPRRSRATAGHIVPRHARSAASQRVGCDVRVMLRVAEGRAARARPSGRSRTPRSILAEYPLATPNSTCWSAVRVPLASLPSSLRCIVVLKKCCCGSG